jgi:hypothetical protein
LARDAPAAVIVACSRALEAPHGVAVHQNLEPNLGKVGISETYAIHASSEAGRRSCAKPRLGQQFAEFSRVFEIIVELIFVRIECPNERERDRLRRVIVGRRAMYTRRASRNLYLDFAASLGAIDSAFENVDTRLADHYRTG